MWRSWKSPIQPLRLTLTDITLIAIQIPRCTTIDLNNGRLSTVICCVQWEFCFHDKYWASKWVLVRNIFPRLRSYSACHDLPWNAHSWWELQHRRSICAGRSRTSWTSAAGNPRFERGTTGWERTYFPHAIFYSGYRNETTLMTLHDLQITVADWRKLRERNSVTQSYGRVHSFSKVERSRRRAFPKSTLAYCLCVPCSLTVNLTWPACAIGATWLLCPRHETRVWFPNWTSCPKTSHFEEFQEGIKV